MKVLLTTFGSLGDLHPYIAVGKGLRERGHSVTLATSEVYRAKVGGEGLGFHAVRPDLGGVIDSPEAIRKAFHRRTGTEYVSRSMVMPFLEGSFEDTLAAARDADLLVGHPLAFATPVVADLLGKPWVSVALAPLSLFSAEDLPAISGVPVPEWLSMPRFWRFFWKFARFMTRQWGEPVQRLRTRLGLPRGAHPIVDGTLSQWGAQGWFSRVLGEPQRDWPTNLTVTGFPFYDRLEAGSAIGAELGRFLDAGPAPVVFTLGSSAVFDAGQFYEESARAARIAGVRAVLLTGRDGRYRLAAEPGDSVFVTEYAPYSELLPHAAATVHQGGVGTTAQALRAGRPMIVVPYSHDQPDNARRVAKLGVARVVRRSQYRAERVAGELKRLLSEPYGVAAGRAGRVVAEEDGVRGACQGIEDLVG